MKLKIMWLDGSIKEQAIVRLFPIKDTHLYFETPCDLTGKGQSISLSEIKCWEVTAPVCGGSQGLKL